MAGARPAIAVYRDDLGLPGEPFVLDHARHYTLSRPVFLGTRLHSSETEFPGAVWIPALSPTGRLLPDKARVAIFRTGMTDWGAKRWLRSQRVVAIHAHFGLDGVSALPLARGTGVPLVVTFHGYDAFTSDDRLRGSYRGQRFIRERDRLADEGALFVAVSHVVRQALLSQGFPAERTEVHYLGTDVELFRPREPHEEARFDVLFAGRLVQQKGVHDLLDVAALLGRSRIGSAPLTIAVAGDGPMSDRIIDRLPIPGVHLSLLGRLSRQSLAEAIRRSRVALAPSRAADDGWVEAFNLFALEAQASAVPVAGYRTGGIPEAVADGVTGLLVEEGDIDSLAEAVQRLLTEGDAFGAAGRRRALTSFDVRRSASQLERRILSLAGIA